MTVGDVSALLDRHGVAHAVIGAVALAVHGVLRASDDVDVLVTDARCLDPTTWSDAEAAGVAIDIRRGDADDPLAGVVRLTSSDLRMDVVVGRSGWQRQVIARARRMSLLATTLPVVAPTDLVLLKLYAGGPQDAWDIDQLLDAVPDIQSEVERSLTTLPSECTALWRRILAGRPHPV